MTLPKLVHAVAAMLLFATAQAACSGGLAALYEFNSGGDPGLDTCGNAALTLSGTTTGINIGPSTPSEGHDSASVIEFTTSRDSYLQSSETNGWPAAFNAPNHASGSTRVFWAKIVSNIVHPDYLGPPGGGTNVNMNYIYGPTFNRVGVAYAAGDMQISTTQDWSKWHHYAFVRTASSLEVFIDGASVGTGGYSVSGTSEDFRLAHNTGQHFLLDDYAVFNVALTSTQVGTIFSSGFGSFGVGGGSGGDPHFKGFRGQLFDISGVPGVTYLWYTDTDISLTGKMEFNPEDGKIYQTHAAVQFGKFVKVEFAPAPNYIAASYPFHVNGTIDDCGRMFFADGFTFVVQWHQYELVLKTMSPIKGTQKYQHIDLTMGTWVRNPDYVHGLLGQTHRPSAVLNAEGTKGEGIIEGSLDDYVVADGKFGTQTKFNRYTHAEGTLSPQQCRQLLASPKVVLGSSAGSFDGTLA